MVRKDLEDGLYIMYNNRELFNSVEDVCSVINIDPEMLMSILDGERNYYSTMTFYCCDSNGVRVRPRYRYINETNTRSIGGVRRGKQGNVACWIGLTREEYCDISRRADRENLRFSDYINEKLSI